MTPHTKAILQKMKGSNYPQLSFDFAFTLTNESERGALLVGSGKVEEFLERLLTKILPLKQKSYRDRLLSYPGPLSSFSGKIEILYAFRVIDKRVYDALSTLRKLRNQAAHSSNSFSIQAIKEKLETIYDFEDGFIMAVNKVANDNLLKFKKENLRKALEESKLDDYDSEKLWEEHVPIPEKNKFFLEHLTIWKLAHGLTFLCLKIEAIIDDYSFVNPSGETWIDYISAKNCSFE